MRNSKGPDFEHEVHRVLLKLAARFPERVKVTAQREFTKAVSGRPHRADFEFEYKLGGLTHQHLIECQNRNRSSYEIADKMYAVRGTSDRSRYILVYKDAEYLSDPVKQRLTSMGVLHFTFEAFQHDFIDQLEADLALHSLGLRVSNALKFKLAKLADLTCRFWEQLRGDLSPQAAIELANQSHLAPSAKTIVLTKNSDSAPQAVKVEPAQKNHLAPMMTHITPAMESNVASQAATVEPAKKSPLAPPKMKIDPAIESLLASLTKTSKLGKSPDLARLLRDLESADKYSPQRRDPPDRAMLSGR